MARVTIPISSPTTVSTTFSVSSGSLPTGMSLDSSTGVISGTPSTVGYNVAGVASTFDITATNSVGSATVKSFTITRLWADGTTAARAATSADAILAINPSATSGRYYLKPASWTVPAQIYCEMTKNGGGWMYIHQRQCINDMGLYWRDFTTQYGHNIHAVNNFSGCQDERGTSYSAVEMWEAFIGSGSATGKFYAREQQTAGGSYDESQRYVSASDGPIWTIDTFRRLFAGNFANGQFQTAVTVYLNDGSTSAASKIGTTWSAPALATINNGATDQNLYFCNGEDGGDTNWSFALMKGGTPYPRLAGAADGGGRNGITRWASIAIKA